VQRVSDYENVCQNFLRCLLSVLIEPSDCTAFRFDLLNLFLLGLPGIWNKASQVHAAAMRVLREYVKDTKPATGQSVKWFTHFPEYRTWINGENMLCHIDFHATDKTTWLSALVSRGDLRGPTLKNTIYVDVAQYRTVNSMEAWTMVLHSLLYQYLHVHRLHIHLRSLDGLFALFHEKGHTSAHGLKRLFGKYDRVNEDHQFMIEALLRLTQDFKRDVMPVVYTVIDRIDQLDSKAGVFIVKELRKKFSCDRIMFCTRPAPAISEALEHLPTISPKTEYRCMFFHLTTYFAYHPSLTTPMLTLSADCLESLHFKEWKDRRSLVDKPLQDTNEWVWKHPSFLEWRSFATILWIKGKPGSGKSTIARMITDSLRDKNAHTSSPDSVTRGPLDYPLIADFFYSARMGERATRHSYMLRSILYQMLDQDNTLYPHFRTTYRLLLETGDGVVSWSLEHLQRVFENVVKERSSERSRICCVLDGFDESKDTDTVDTKQVIGEKTQVLSWLSGLAMSRDSQSRLTLIILSRPAAEITKYLGRFPYITVEDYNRPAILKIVDDGLCSMKNAISTWIQVDSGNYIEEEGLSQTWDDETDKALESLRRLLLERADGQILWVNLVLRELQIEFAGKGAYSPKLLEEILDSLPEGLERLYEELIRRLQRRLSSRELDRARSMLTLVCSAPRPLSLTEFRDALAMRDWKGSSSSAPFQDHLDARRIRLFQKYNWAPIERDIVDTCGCLLEVVRPASALSQPTSELRKGYIGPEFTIQTSHQTAKEFLTRGSRAQPLDIVPEQARRYISDTLLAYISASIQMPLDATIGPVIQWESGDYMMFAKYVEDRPLLPYAMEFFQKYQKDEQSSTMINQYIQELRERPEEHGWCLWRRGGRMEDTKRFIAEIEGLKRLKHRHIVEYIGGFTDSRTFCTIMSPSADVSLGAYMESKSGQLLMPEDQSLIRSFFGCLATALAHLHFSYSIRHKDISPSNILLHGSNILLTNFASSFDWTETDRSTTQDETDTITPLYAAPEVAGYGFSYSSSDIWSLGCVFLEMFAFLNSYTIEQLRTYFESHGTYGRLYHQNPLAVTELLLKLESTAQLEDRRAIPWIRDMLRVQQDERPTARRLVDNIAKSVLTSPPGFRFCGACCLSDRRKLVNSVANRQRSASDDAFR